MLAPALQGVRDQRGPADEESRRGLRAVPESARPGLHRRGWDRVVPVVHDFGPQKCLAATVRLGSRLHQAHCGHCPGLLPRNAGHDVHSQRADAFHLVLGNDQAPDRPGHHKQDQDPRLQLREGAPRVRGRGQPSKVFGGNLRVPRRVRAQRRRALENVNCILDIYIFIYLIYLYIYGVSVEFCPFTPFLLCTCHIEMGFYDRSTTRPSSTLCNCTENYRLRDLPVIILQGKAKICEYA
ncbi:MAG: hypothetical protein BJ554DRAFT_444 [Olpidium bornovanus]|uniref:Uncharacterized protein n=1 Tax=Olpidium bornovanus TaxID=278681 RepID=A0A8H8DM31_9FUNG|nr:MAG: hypothetical protein BJ554DRAFT_444 [Olpidium bornovanus]